MIAHTRGLAGGLARAVLPALLALLILGSTTADAQYRRVVLDSDADARVVAIAIRFPAGSTEDPRGSEGTAFMLGRVLERQGDQALSRHGASLTVTVGPQEFLILLVTEPESWEDALGELESILFQASVREDILEAIRAELSQILRFEAGAPVRAFEAERTSFLLGPEHLAARPFQGAPETIERIGTSDLEAFRSTHIHQGNAILALSGPSDSGGRMGENDVLLLERSLTSEGRPEPLIAADSTLQAPDLRLYRTVAPGLEVPQESPGPPAWTAGARLLLDRELTSSWISVAFPFPLGTPELLLDFIGHLVVEELTPSPPDPGLFAAQAEQTTINGAPVLVITASVDPRATARWEDRLVESLATLAEAPPAGAFFELTRRRFRAGILLEHALPEQRVGWLARQVASGADPAIDLGIEVWSLLRPAVGRAAAAAGPPRTIVMGPGAMMGN